MSKIRIYDLAKELKLDSKKIMDEVRRFGYDVRVASNSVPDDIAEKVRNQYYPKRTAPPPAIKLMKHGHVAGEAPASAASKLPSVAAPPASGPKLIKVVKKIEPAAVAVAQSPESLSSAPVESSSAPAVEAKAQPFDAPPATRIIQIETPPPQPPQAPPPAPSESEKPETAAAAQPTSMPTSMVRQIQVPPAEQIKPQAPPPQAFQLRPIPVPPPRPATEQTRPGQVREFTRPIPTPGREPNRPPTPGQGREFPPRPGQGQPQARDARPSEGTSGRPPRHRPPTAEDGRSEAEKAAPGAAPQRTTYIPPKNQNRKGRRSGARGPATVAPGGKREHNERDFRLRPGKQTFTPPPRPVFTELKPIRVTEGTTVKELAEKLEVKPKDVVALIFSKGLLVTINQTLSEEMMREVGREFGFEVSTGTFEEMVAAQELIEETAGGGDEETRAPVVTVMGHVDHGKTSLLDAIRNTRVAAGEAGGITQHIGAYSVEVPDPDNREVKRRIVFLDTPGHEAFTMMRARGAKGADVAVIVVAADDGVMPQTIEAIDHARAAGVPMVVAINKIDKPDANVDRVKKELGDQGLVWDGWGGETVMVEISAKKRINLDSLLEMILLTSDILDLKANPKRLASGVVLEARLDKGRGPVASILVQTGTLRVGDPIIAGLNFGRVRALFNDLGRQVTEAGPAIPVEVLGLQGVPKAGDLFQVVNDPSKAQEIAEWRQSKHRMAVLSSTAARGLEDVFEQMKSGKLKELLVILKADVQGSVEVLRDTLEKLSTEKVKVRVIRSDVGAITESDVLLASASNDMAHTSVIIGFNVRPAPRVADLAKQEKVDIRLHTIIYKVEEEMRKAMIGMLDPTTKEVYLGRADVRQVIKVPKFGNIAGCQVTDGIIKRTGQVRVLRDGTVVFESPISSLRRFKDDVGEVKAGFECGISIERFNDLKIGDVLEVFATEKVLPTEL